MTVKKDTSDGSSSDLSSDEYVSNSSLASATEDLRIYGEQMTRIVQSLETEIRSLANCSPSKPSPSYKDLMISSSRSDGTKHLLNPVLNWWSISLKLRRNYLTTHIPPLSLVVEEMQPKRHQSYHATLTDKEGHKLHAVGQLSTSLVGMNVEIFRSLV